LVNFIDFAPSMLSLTGIDIPSHMQGVPFLGEKAVEQEPEFIYAFRDRMDERYDMSRVVRGKRYKYIRNYMPHRIYGQHLTFLWQAKGMQAWEQACKLGHCNARQMRFWQTKPAEELYDIEKDPHELNNLAMSNEYASILEQKRAAHKKWTLNIYDTGFVPEAELLSRIAAAKTTAYDFIRNPKFPYMRVVETAEMATMGLPKDFNELARRLNDDEAVVRYWAAVACCIQPELARSQKEKLLRMATSDPSISTRIVAIEALFKTGGKSEAMTIMADLVKNNSDDIVLLQAFNIIDSFGDCANDLRKEIVAIYPDEKFTQRGTRFYSPRIIAHWRTNIEKAEKINITQPHPRLLLLEGEEEQIKAKIRESEFLREVHNYIINRCNQILNEPLLERIITGRRLLSISRRALENIYYLSYAWRMTGDDRYAARAEKEMVNVSNFKDWNPSHFLDAAEMTFALSIGYDWLYSYISEQTKEAVRKAIVEKGINESVPETSSHRENYHYLKKVNNWNPVCNTGMAFGAIVTFEQNPELSAKIIQRSADLVRDRAMHEYQPHGNYPEGYTYWSYGTSFNVMLIDAFEKALGTCFGMTDNQGFMNTGNYILNMTTQNLSTFNYSDCGDIVMSFPMFWFAKRNNNPDLIWGEMQKYQYMKANPRRRGPLDVRFLPSVMLWASSETLKSNPLPPTQRLYVGQGTTPVALLRNHWGGDDEIFVGLKGGRCNFNHAHMDIGSFVMYRGANQWAKDAGIQDYYSLELHGLTLGNRTQRSSRWDAFRFGNKIHNIMIFSDSLQRVNGVARIDDYGETEGFVFAVSNLTAPNEGTVENYERGVAIVENRYVIVRDEITNIDRQNPIRWAMFTPATPRIIDKNTAELILNGEKMIYKVIGKDVELQTWSTEPPNVWDAPNPGTVLLGFTSTLAPSEKASITVYLVPAEEYRRINYQIPALSEWNQLK